MTVLADIPTTPWRATYIQAAQFLARGMWAGLFAGLLINGIGGRLAMFVLRLTLDDSLRGSETDDRFIIGRFSGDTIFLLGLGAVTGALGGLIYLDMREGLPRPWPLPLFGRLGATAGGALIINPGGPDFTLLEPRLLAVLLFIAVPSTCGVCVSVLADAS